MSEPLDTVIEAAQALARVLAGHPRFIRLRDVEARVFADEGARDLADRFHHLRKAMRGKEAALTPVEPEEKRQLAALLDSVRGNPLLLELNRAQADYAEMMELVNRTLSEVLALAHRGE